MTRQTIIFIGYTIGTFLLLLLVIILSQPFQKTTTRGAPPSIVKWIESGIEHTDFQNQFKGKESTQKYNDELATIAKEEDDQIRNYPVTYAEYKEYVDQKDNSENGFILDPIVCCTTIIFQFLGSLVFSFTLLKTIKKDQNIKVEEQKENI